MNIKIILKEDRQVALEEIFIVSHPENSDLLRNMKETLSYQEIYAINAMNNRKIRLSLADIVAIESEGKMCNLKLVTGEMYLYDRRLKYMLEDFSTKDFFQINNQTIINKNYVKSFATASNARIQVNLVEGSTYFVSRHYLKTFKERLR